MFEAIFTFLFKYRPVLFTNGRFSFAAPLSTALLIVLGAVAAGTVIWTYTRVGGKATARDRMVLLGLRAAALAVLVFCLFQPILVVSNVVPQQNWVGILIDDSKSMRVTDGAEGVARSDIALEHFGAESELVKALSEKFQVRLFRFAGQMDRMNDVSELAFAGSRTELGSALDRGREELAHVPVSGLVLVSDGADNSHAALTDQLLSLKASNVPVFTVGIGREKFEKDVELARVSTPRSALKGSSLVVDLMVSQSGFTGETIQIFVEDNGQIVQTQDVALPSEGEPTAVRVTFPANEAGLRRFRFRVPTQTGEEVVENNVQEALIVVSDERPKILYFEGEPRSEVAFLRRAIAEDENLHVVVLQRTADAKYMRLDVDSAEELSSGFPKTREELFRYKALILGTVEASHFTLEQLRMIADFVSERGAGLLALGGPRSFSEGGYAGTPVADALPVELDGSRMNDSTFFPDLKVQLARAGASHVVTNIAGEEMASAEKWTELPELSTFNRITRVKPGATTLLTASGRGVDEQIALAYERYGRGLSIALPMQDTWMWQMGMELEDESHETFWRQLLRWLVSGTPDQVTVTLASDRVEPGERLRISAGVDDERFSRVNNAKVMAHVRAPSGAELDVPLEWTVERDGEYNGAFLAEEPGLYEVTVDAEIGTQTFTSDPAFADAAESTNEYFGSQMRKPTLQRIAQETGGRFYTPADLSTLPEDLSVTGKGVTVQEEKELWDMPFLLFLLLGLVGGEWAYRRRRNLA
jgi:uncharacterized membrane protein